MKAIATVIAAMFAATVFAAEPAKAPATPAPAATAKPIPTEADRARGRSNPTSRQNFINHFGVEP